MFRSEENLTLKLTVRMKNIQKIKTGLNILTNPFPMQKKNVIKKGKNSGTKINNTHNVIDITLRAK